MPTNAQFLPGVLIQDQSTEITAVRGSDEFGLFSVMTFLLQLIYSNFLLFWQKLVNHKCFTAWTVNALQSRCSLTLTFDMFIAKIAPAHACPPKLGYQH